MYEIPLKTSQKPDVGKGLEKGKLISRVLQLGLLE